MPAGVKTLHFLKNTFIFHNKNAALMEYRLAIVKAHLYPVIGFEGEKKEALICQSKIWKVKDLKLENSMSAKGSLMIFERGLA